MEFTFGSDPEFHLTRDGKCYSAIGIVQGDRDHRIDVLGHQFYYDNVLAEAAILPGKTKKEVVNNVRECLGIYARMVQPYKLAILSAHDYPDEQMSSKASREVGCNQEWCAYALQVIKPPEGIMKHTNFRTAGGHIHLGGGGVLQNSWEKPFVIYMLDLFLAVPSLFLDKDPSSKDRRTMYGFAGSHRDTDYGLEYRPLGAFWLGSPRSVELIWDLCDFVLNFVSKGLHKKFWVLDEDLLDEEDPSVAYRCVGYDTTALRAAINSCDLEAAKTFMLFIEQYLPPSITRRIHEHKETEDLYTEWSL